MPVPAITLRLVKGSGLSVVEMDNNFIVLRDFANGLESLFLVTHNADGTIKLLNVTSAMLAASSVIGSKIAVDAVTEAKVADQAITARKIANAIAGPGLLKAANADAISVDVDGDTIIFDGNQLKLGAVYPDNLDASIPFRNYETVTGDTLGTTLPAANAALSIVHTLGVAPSFFRAVIHCNTNDGSFLAGDEVDVSRVIRATNNLQGIAAVPRVGTVEFGVASTGGGLKTPNLTDGTLDPIALASWQLKAYLAV